MLCLRATPCAVSQLLSARLGRPAVRRRALRTPAAASAPNMAQSAADNAQDDYSSRWENNYWGKEGGLKQGEAFDAGKSSPALTALLASGGLDVDGKRVLIPGCGRGYDLIEFVRAGAAEVAGLELAPSAQQAATGYLATQLTAEEQPKAQVFAGDFFKWAHPSGAQFDVAYDYTFCCALHPDMRQDWAAAYARYLAPGARLVCLIFPIDPERETGPPWPVTPELYKQLLEPAGFKCESITPVPEAQSHQGRGGKEALGIFVRQ